MDHDKQMKGAAVFASGYVKRWLEHHYDTLMRTAPARKLMEASAPTRYGIEASMNALFAYVDQHWSTHTPMRTLLREVAIDVPAELSKRLVNGFREEVLAAAKEKSEQTKSVERALLQLDEATLGSLLAWLARTTREERAKIQSLLAMLSDEELRKVARLEPKDLEVLLTWSSPTEAPPVPEKPPSRLAQAIRDELKEAHQRADEQLAARRSRKKT